MIDQSGSMEPEFDQKLKEDFSRMKDHLTKNIVGGTDMGKALKDIFNDMTDLNSKNRPPLIFTGNAGAGKSEMIKKIADDLIKNSSYDPNNKVLIIDDSISTGKDMSDAMQDLLNSMPSSAAIQKRFAPITLNPLTPEQMRSIADIHISKKGVTGEMGDIIREIAADHIAKHGTQNGARDVFNLIDKLIANPDAPQIAAKQAQRADARQLVASRAEGAVMAEAMRKGVKVVIRPIKPVRFK